MYFFVYHVKPSPKMKNAANIAGAYVSCWIEAASITIAEKVAEKKIELTDWQIIELDESFEIGEDHYSKDSESFQFYKQALIDKWVLRFHTYPFE